MREHGFSLVEILVVIAIIGILAALAIPAYKNYTIKAKIARAITTLQYVNSVIVEKYDRGKLGSTVLVGNTTISNGVTTSFPVGSVMQAVYFNNASGVPSQVVLTCVYISGLDAMNPPANGASYVAPTSSSQGVRSGLCILTSQSASGINNQYCGIWTSDTGSGGNNYLPSEYLPKGCDCTNLVNTSCY